MFVSSIFSDCLEGQQVESLIKAETMKTRESSAVASPSSGLQSQQYECSAATLYPNSQTYKIFMQKGRRTARFPKLTGAAKNGNLTTGKTKHSRELVSI